MVGVAQLEEPQVVALVVAGSSPVAHPQMKNRCPVRLVVRTQDFHSCNRGSTPLRDAHQGGLSMLVAFFRFFLPISSKMH